ncbi:MAG: hypothetical protein KKF44_11135 [Nanoarchaeota archaeon]|nr:hypothetical protein [Nanoarchaeota archaeon]
MNVPSAKLGWIKDRYFRNDKSLPVVFLSTANIITLVRLTGTERIM